MHKRFNLLAGLDSVAARHHKVGQYKFDGDALLCKFGKQDDSVFSIVDELAPIQDR
jgi:hypothetical protein